MFKKIRSMAIVCTFFLASSCGGAGGSSQSTGGGGGGEVSAIASPFGIYSPYGEFLIDVRTYLDKFELAGSPANAFYNQYVSLFGTPVVYNQFDLTLQNLPWNSSQQVIYERYQVETRSVPGNGALSFTASIAAPSVQVIKVHL